MTKRMQVLQLLEKKQEQTGKRLDRLLDIFDETGLSSIRRGKKALAEEANLVLDQHASEWFEILRSRLSEEEVERLTNEGKALVKNGGFGRPLNILGVMAVGPEHLRLNQADSAAEIIAQSPGYTEDYKKLAKVFSEELKFGIVKGAVKHALRSHKLTSILHPVLRRSTKRDEESRIEEAVAEFEGDDMKMAPQWYEVTP